MSSFFLRPEHAVGVMKQGGFYRLVKCGDTYQKVWCCDAFSVEKRILKLNAIDDEPETLIVEFIVKFKSLEENHVEFSWDLISLAYLSKGNQLQQVLCCAGLRCSPEPKAAFAIINAIQCSDLVFTL